MEKIKKALSFVSFSALSLGAQGLVFIFNIIIANKLSIAEYGIYSLIFSVVNLLVLLSCQWHTSMIQYCGSSEFAQKGSLKETNYVRNILFITCYAVILVFCILLRNSINHYVGGQYVAVILIIVFAKSLQELFSSYLIAIGKRQISAINLFIIQIICLLTLFLFKVDISTVLLIQIAANILILQMIPYVNGNDYKPCHIKSETFKICIQFAMWQLMGSIAIYIISYGDNYIIKLFLTYDDIAKYNAAYKIFNAVFIASNTIATFYISPIAKALSEKDGKVINNIFWNERIVIFSLCTLLHIALIVFAPQLLNFLYRGKYNDSILIFRVLMMASVIRYWTVFEMVYFNSVGKIKIQQMLNVVSAILKVALSFILIGLFGLIGISYSTLISTLIVGCASFALSERSILKLTKNDW